MNKSDITRNYYMLKGRLAKKGYDWWWHSFTGYHHETKEPKTFFVEYYIMNPGLGGDEPILGQLEANKKAGIKPSYVMIKCGAWGEGAKQLHSFYPLSELRIVDDSLNLSVGNCFLSEEKMFGQVIVSPEDAKFHPERMSDSGSMSWNLKIDKQIPFNVGYGASKLLRRLNVFEMFWHVEGMKTLFSGKVTYDNEIYDVIPEESYGYADKNWGRNFTSPWVWLSSCNLESRRSSVKLNNSAIDMGGGRPKVLGIPLNRKLLIALNYEGESYEFNFSKFWTGVNTKFACTEKNGAIVWEINTENKDAILKLKCTCKKEEMLLINYESPDGKKRHDRLWNGGTGKGIIMLYKKEKGGRKIVD